MITMLILDIHKIILLWGDFKVIFKKIWSKIKPFCSWRILLCYLPFWFIATGWAWLFSIIGSGWIKSIALTWLGIMWLPCCPEKLITIPLAIWLHQKLFPNRSVEVLQKSLQKEKENFKKRK